MRKRTRQPDCSLRDCQPGFTLVAVMSLMALLLVVGLGLLSLSAIQLRSSDVSVYAERAQANARMALVLAIGQLQKQMGPDTRVSAKAELLDRGGTIKQPNWTGVWSTRMPDGGPVFTRDDAAGGLHDRRQDAKTDGQRRALGWLVSGKTTGPEGDLTSDAVELVGSGTLHSDNPAGRVVAPAVALDPAVPGGAGRIAWWTGDLGVKANISVPDLFEGQVPDETAPTGGGWYRLLVGQEADTRLLPGAPDLQAKDKNRLASVETLRPAWPGSPPTPLFHDITAHSEGVLANVVAGRLKRDLTAFFQGNGQVDSWKGLPGLRDDDRLVGPANAQEAATAGVSWAATRHRNSAPRFGLLRRWANTSAAFGKVPLDAVSPKTETLSDPTVSRVLALGNEKPATVAAFDTPDLFPALVEGSYYWTMTWHKNITPTSNGSKPMPYQVRLHVYPRVVLWNPWNVTIRMQPCMAMIQGNGRFEMWTDCITSNGNQDVVQWIGTEGGRDPNFESANGDVLASSGYTNPYMGSYIFSLPQTDFKAGECLVFTPSRSAEYQRTTAANTSYALELNELSCRVPPDPSRNYYVSNDEVDGGMDFYPTTYWFAPTTWNQPGRHGIENQGDDCRVILKNLGNRTHVTFEDFDKLPQVAMA